MSKYIDFDELISFLQKHREEKFLITFHSIGDRDSVGSSIGLNKFLANSVIATPDFITASAKRMLAQISAQTEILTKIPEDVSGFVILDANNFGVLGNFRDKIKGSNKKILLIDHHLNPREDDTDMLLFNSEEFNSASSIVCEILKKLNCKLDRSSAIALLNGIVADSGEFHNMFTLTFRQIAELLEISKLSYSEFIDYFSEKVPVDNRYKVMKDLSGSKIGQIGDYLLVYGNASVHANIAAEMAMKLGADASLFWVSGGREVSISARLKPPLDKKLSVHLGKIMQSISSLIDGQGGGHPCAAGAYGPDKSMLKKATDQILVELREKLSQRR